MITPLCSLDQWKLRAERIDRGFRVSKVREQGHRLPYDAIQFWAEIKGSRNEGLVRCPGEELFQPGLLA